MNGQSGSSWLFKRFDRLHVIVVSVSVGKKLILNLFFFVSEKMVVSVEEIKNIAYKTFDFVVRHSAKLAIKKMKKKMKKNLRN